MLNTTQQATIKVSVGTTERNDSPPIETNKTDTRDAQGRLLQCQTPPSRLLSSQPAESSNQTVVTDSRKRSALVVIPRPESAVAPASLPSQDNNNPEKSQIQDVNVQHYSKHFKMMISIPNPELDPEGYELGMNAYVKSNLELADMCEKEEGANKQHPHDVNSRGMDIRSSYISEYKEHLRQKKYNAGWPIT